MGTLKAAALRGLVALVLLGGCETASCPDPVLVRRGGACACPDGTVTDESRLVCILPDGGLVPYGDAGPADAGRDAGRGDGADAGRTDAGSRDAGAVDAATVDGGDSGPRPTRPALVPAAGGGSGSSAGYRVHLSIGAPQPMGTASAPTGRAELGPEVGR